MAELRQPVETHPQDIVENVFPMPEAIGSMQDAEPMVRDWTTVFEMEDFLVDRLRPDAQPTPGGVLTIPVGEEEYTTKLPRLDRWNYWLSDSGDNPRQHWKRAAAILLGVNVLLNLVNGNTVSAVKDTVEGAQQVKDGIEDHFHIGEITQRRTIVDRTPTERTRITTQTLRFNSGGETQPVGESVVDEDIVDTVLGDIAQHERQGQPLERAQFIGVSSDDWRRDPVHHGIGHPNRENSELAAERLQETKARLVAEAEAQGIDLSGAEFSFREAVLSETDALALENAVMESGAFDGKSPDDALDAALELYNNDPAQLPTELREIMSERLPRGFQATLSYKVTEKIPGEDHVEVRHKTTKHPDGEPGNDKHDYDMQFLPFILPPLPEGSRKKRKRVLTEDVILPPTMPAPEYLKLYPDARKEDGTLVNSSWAYTRKYQHLMRETDRLKAMYQLDYVDGEGIPRRLRAMFVDHEPTEATFGRVAELLQTISQIQDGRVGRELDMIAIYPSDNAGRRHGNPKKIALGQDIQFEESILGVAYASLGLVEMHMPPDSEEEDMGQYMSPDWVLAHEVAGHFTDLNDEQNRLIPLGVRRANGAEVFATNDRHADFMQGSFDRAEAEEATGRPTRWRVHRRLENARGEIVDDVYETTDPTRRPSRFRVVNAVRRAVYAVRNEHGGLMTTGDPRFSEAIYISKETGHVTRYGGTNNAERHAESAAAELVSEIPFSQAHDGAGIVTRPGFASGYHIASRDRVALAERWGSDPTHRGVVFTDPETGDPVKRPDWRHWYGRPEQDQAVRALMNQARRLPIPAEQDLIHIVTGTRWRT